MARASKADRQLINSPVGDLSLQDEQGTPGQSDDWDSIVRSFGRLWARAYLRAHTQEEPRSESEPDE